MLQEKTFNLFRQFTAKIPHFCTLCHGRCKNGLCPDCEERYFHHDTARCHRCAIPVAENKGENTVCGNCLTHPLSFDQAIAVTSYTPPIDQLVQSLKFGGNLAVANLIAKLMEKSIRNHCISENSLPSVLSVVPLFPKRLSCRGFNQSLEICKPLALSLGIPVIPDLTHRMRDTVPQSTIRLNERRENMRDAFAVNNTVSSIIMGKHIGIVDDVLTTGETLNELAASLKKAGADRITCFVFARTPL